MPLRALRRRVTRYADAESAVWVIPLAVIWVVYDAPRHVLSDTTALTGLVAVGVLALAAKRPDRSLLTLIVVFPFQGLILAKLYAWGLPGSVVRHLGAWKELLALGVVLAGVRNLIASRERLDGLDRLALGYVLIVILYALLQTAIAPGAPSASNVRLVGFREDAAFVLLLFGARHAPLGTQFARRAARTLFAAAAFIAAIGIYEALDSAGWNRFVVRTIGYARYQIQVLNAAIPNPNDLRVTGSVGGLHVTRIGSVFVNELNLSFWLVFPFAIGFERVVRRTATPLIVISTVVIGIALVLTQTRSAMIAALVVAFLALQPAAGRRRPWRIQATIVLAGLAIVFVPAALASGFANRVAATGSSTDNSSAGHVKNFTDGVSRIASHPLGQGLGTAAGVGQRFQASNRLVPENQYLDYGVELGVLPMFLFIALTVAMIRRLRHAARLVSDPLITAAWAAGFGIALGGMFLQSWQSFEVSWTFWGMAGASLAVVRARALASARHRESAAELAPAPVAAPSPVAIS